MALLVLGLLVFAFQKSGSFLVLENGPTSDALVVTQGDSLDDAYWAGLHVLMKGEAHDLFVDARTDRIFFGQSQAALAEDFIRKTATEYVDRVHVCPITAATTAGETYQVQNCLRGRSIRSAMIVVGDFHTRRSVAIFSRLLPQYRWSAMPVHNQSTFDPHWWRRRVWIRTAVVEWQHLLWWELLDRWRFAPMTGPS